MLTWPHKDPSDILDYAINFGPALDAGDAIQSVTWSVVPAGLTVGAQSLDAGKASVWLSGGTGGITYRVTARAVTSAGRQMDRSAPLFVTKR